MPDLQSVAAYASNHSFAPDEQARAATKYIANTTSGKRFRGVCADNRGMTAFSTLPLAPATLANLQQLGFDAMTPIQAASLPVAPRRAKT